MGAFLHMPLSPLHNERKLDRVFARPGEGSSVNTNRPTVREGGRLKRSDVGYGKIQKLK